MVVDRTPPPRPRREPRAHEGGAELPALSVALSARRPRNMKHLLTYVTFCGLLLVVRDKFPRLVHGKPGIGVSDSWSGAPCSTWEIGDPPSSARLSGPRRCLHPAFGQRPELGPGPLRGRAVCPGRRGNAPVGGQPVSAPRDPGSRPQPVGKSRQTPVSVNEVLREQGRARSLTWFLRLLA